MKNRLMLTLAASSLAAIALAGCSGAGGSSSSDAAGPGAASSASSPAAGSGSDTGGSDAAVASSSLGQIVVDGKGMTAYFFDKDTPNSGKSACTGQCDALWPAITSSSETPQVTGITGKVGTITGTDGGHQITIDGRPIYTFANDKAAGDVNGQGLMGVWYVVSPSGMEIKTAAGSAPASSSPAGGY